MSDQGGCGVEDGERKEGTTQGNAKEERKVGVREGRKGITECIESFDGRGSSREVRKVEGRYTVRI